MPHAGRSGHQAAMLVWGEDHFSQPQIAFELQKEVFSSSVVKYLELENGYSNLADHHLLTPNVHSICNQVTFNNNFKC